MINRDELESKIQKFFKENNEDKKVYNEFADIMQEKHNVLAGETIGAFLGKKSLEDLSDEELFWYSHIAANYSKGIKGLDLKNFFSPSEIKQYKTSKKNNKLTPYPMEFSVKQVAYDQWVGTIDANTLYEMYTSQVIAYNFETQRNPIIRYTKSGEEQQEINVNKKSIENIMHLLDTHSFIANTLTLNMREDDPDIVWEYDSFNETLVIKGGKLDIIDGYHRYQAIVRKKMEKPDFNFTMIINFVNFDIEKAKRFIAQENKRNKINSDYAKSLDDTSFGVQVANKMNDDHSFYLNGKFKPYLSKNSSFMLGRVASAVDEAFNIKTNQEASKVRKYLVTNINSILDEEEDIIKTDIDIRIAIDCLSILRDSDEDERIENTLKVLHSFKTINKYDGAKSFSTIKKIISNILG